MKRAPSHLKSAGFTLLEILIASVAASLVLICVYGLFAGAVKMRDTATELNRKHTLRARAMSVMRNDLKNALISGGILASSLQGDATSPQGGSSFPGYLKFTTTTGKDTATELYGDVQQVEYYIVADTTGTNAGTGTLVRVITRDLLDVNQSQGTSMPGTSTGSVTHQENILQGVQSFQVSFFDGTTWQPSWMISGSSATSGSSGTTSATTSTSTSGTAASGTNSATPTLPEAIKVDIQMASTPGVNPNAVQANLPPPLEIVVPWMTVPFLSGTNFSVGSDATQ